SEACDSARHRFWSAVEAEVTRRDIHYAEVVGIDKLVAAYFTAAVGSSERIRSGVTGPVARVDVRLDAEACFRNVECGGGLFFEAEIESLSQLAQVLVARD